MRFPLDIDQNVVQLLHLYYIARYRDPYHNLGFYFLRISLPRSDGRERRETHGKGGSLPETGKKERQKKRERAMAGGHGTIL